MIKHILFDFDGTIADTFEVGLGIINNLADKYHYSQIKSKDLKYLQTKTIFQVFTENHIPLYKFPFIINSLRSELKNHMGLIEPFPGLVDLIKVLDERGLSLHLISANTVQNINIFLQIQGISQFKSITASSPIFGKVGSIRKILKTHNIDKSQAIYIGDEIRDIIACKKVGIKIASVAWGYNSVQGLKPYNPDYLVYTVDELKQLIERISSS